MIPLKFEKPVPTQDSITACLVMESSWSSSLQSTLNVSLKKSRRWRRNCILKERNRSHVDRHKLAPSSRGSLLSVTCRSICNRSRNTINRSTRDDQGTKVTQNSVKIESRNQWETIKESTKVTQNCKNQQLNDTTKPWCHFVFGTTADQKLLWESQAVFMINDLVPVANTSTRTHKCLLSLTVTYVYGVSSPK